MKPLILCVLIPLGHFNAVIERLFSEEDMHVGHIVNMVYDPALETISILWDNYPWDDEVLFALQDLENRDIIYGWKRVA